MLIHVLLLFTHKPRYQGRAWGGIVRYVTCAHCGTEFVYELRRVVEHSVESTAGRQTAQSLATFAAQQQLVATLANDHDLVPCPTCARLQPTMNRTVQRRWIGALVIAWVVLLFAAFFGYMGTPPGRDAPPWTIWLPVVATSVFVACVIVVTRTEFTRAATSRAQPRGEAEAQGYVQLGMPRVLRDGWMWVRASLFEPAEICAGCGAAPTCAVHCRLGWRNVRLPTCRTCRRRTLCKSMALGALIVLGPAAVAVGMVMRDPLWDGMNLMAGLMIGGAAGAILLGVMQATPLSRWGMPVRFRRFHARQDSVEVKFRCPDAAEHFLARSVEKLTSASNA